MAKDQSRIRKDLKRTKRLQRSKQKILWLVLQQFDYILLQLDQIFETYQIKETHVLSNMLGKLIFF